MKNCLFLLVVFAVCTTAYAEQQPTQRIRGIVIDKDSRKPLPGVTIQILKSTPKLGAISSSSGTFAIANVPVGRYDLQATSLGYEPVITREIIVTSAKETFVTIAMKEAAVSLGEVVVTPLTVSKAEPLNSMSSVSARMLSVEEAKRYAGGFDDPARLASSFAGVASGIGNNGIVVRGNAPKFLQWKIEDIEIPNPNHFADMSGFGGGGLTALSSQLLANSDFLTGAFPAEYTNALSGVFDIFMRSGNSSDYEHTVQFGLVGIDIASEGPFSKESKSSYLFNYRYSTLALLTPLLPDDAGGTSYQDLSFKLTFPSGNGTFSLWGIGLIDASGQTAETDSTLWKYLQDKEEQDVQQSMGAVGLSYAVLPGENTFFKTTLAATVSTLNLDTKRMNAALTLLPQNAIHSSNWNVVLSSSLTTKFSAEHTNKTGITLTGLRYTMALDDAGTTQVLQSITNENGFSALLAGYTGSSVQLSKTLTMTAGICSQFFTLNSHATLEPRLAFRYQPSEGGAVFGIGYGNHSRLERINYYFSTSPEFGSELVNKHLDFTKAHHLVVSYSQKISDEISLKVEPYMQYIYNVPVIADSSFSFINLQNEWFVSKKLENRGEGRNYGIDLTLEKYLSDGYYFLVSGSVFHAEYLAGDGIWRNSRSNKNFLGNLLVGKEWQFGNAVLSANIRLTVQGGDRFSPVKEAESIAARDVVYDQSRAFALQTPVMTQAHWTMSYRINNQGVSHEIALKILNATMQKDFYGYRYNFRTNSIDENSEAIFIPNLSYKIEF